MKRISTLVTFFACTSIFAVNSYSQNISQNFNSQAELDLLNSECWSFSGNIGLTNAAQSIEGASSLYTGNNNGAFSLTTPELFIPASLEISFSYEAMNGPANGEGGRKIFVELVGTDTTSLVTIEAPVNGDFSFSQVFAVVGSIKKVQIRSTGAFRIKLDELAINAPYTHLGGCNPDPIILPIKLSAFSGNMSNGNVNLDWSVTENETGDYFEVEKSDNGSKFIKAATVPVTNAYGSANYNTQLKADASNVNYYRLKLINKDGSTSYSKVLSFRNNHGSNTTLKVLQNPIVNGLTFNYQTQTNGEYQVSLVSANGLRVLSTPMNLQKGTNLVSLNVNSSLPNGIYILEVARGAERSIVKIIKLKE